eukprot:CAMPEP_0185690672 /NCGR_PEP_ID=MMETSP1164-20130828/1283_1 /TAXON_ID=1104430 /ORGANISM="Chrysoreinhardia sp, Strain CCMP2950" /LENGTH=77 /DNA_ID=CAMNT_0028357267 /DNA_START=71 /DNA_END=300 /DNA_ORIENTATION=-
MIKFKNYDAVSRGTNALTDYQEEFLKTLKHEHPQDYMSKGGQTELRINNERVKMGNHYNELLDAQILKMKGDHPVKA